MQSYLALLYYLLTLCIYLTNLKKLPPHLFSLSFPKLHVSMCYNLAGKQKKNRVMSGATNPDPQNTTTKHSLTLNKESADLFFLALGTLFLS